jgi:hypothetical protein
VSETVRRFAGQVDQAWLDRVIEPVLKRPLPIMDPHHHLWIRDNNVYWLPELMADLSSGHNATGRLRCASALLSPAAPRVGAPALGGPLLGARSLGLTIGSSRPRA